MDKMYNMYLNTGKHSLVVSSNRHNKLKWQIWFFLTSCYNWNLITLNLPTFRLCPCTWQDRTLLVGVAYLTVLKPQSIYIFCHVISSSSQQLTSGFSGANIWMSFVQLCGEEFKRWYNAYLNISDTLHYVAHSKKDGRTGCKIVASIQML